MHGAKYNFCVWPILENLLCCLNPIHHRHGEIQHYHIGAKLEGFLHGFLTVHCLSAYFPPFVLIKQMFDPAPDDIRIIGYQYTGHFFQTLLVTLLPNNETFTMK